MANYQNAVINGETLEVPATAAQRYFQVGEKGEGNGAGVRVGDVIVFEKSPESGITAGVAYEVVKVDFWDDAQIIDDDGVWYDTCDYEFTVYRKADEAPMAEAAPKRLTVGDYAKVVGPNDNHNDYKIGEIVKLVSYEELGDRHLYTGERFDGSVGNFLRHYQLVPATQADFEAQKPKKSRLKVGDYAKQVGEALNSTKRKDGDIVIITEDDRSGRPFKCDHLNGEWAGWAYESDLVPATDEEVRAAREDQFELVTDTKKAAPVRVPVGSYVRVTVAGVGLAVGSIAKVTKDDGSNYYPYRCELLGGSDYNWFNARDFEVLTEADVQLELERLKWAAIGRKVGEYKAGDIVRIVRDQCGDPVGTVTEVIDVSVSGIGHSVKAVVSSRVTSWAADTDAIELVTPVEQRFDKTAEKAAS